MFWEMPNRPPAADFAFFTIPTGATPLGRLTAAGQILSGMRPGAKDRLFGQRALVLLTGGGGNYSDALGNEATVRPGSVIHVFPTLRHSYGPATGNDWEEIFVCYEGAVFDSLENHGVLDRASPIWRFNASAYWERRLHDLLAQWTTADHSFTPLQAVSQWLEFLAEASAAAGRTPAGEAWLPRVHHLLDKETRLPLSMPPERLAALCGLSYESLRKKFRQSMGCGLVEYHRRRIVDRAAVMLDRTRLTHAEIADLLGFCDEFHFAKMFKRYSGQTPGQARKQSFQRRA